MNGFGTDDQLVLQSGMLTLNQNFANSDWPPHWVAVRRF
jgi:hypothetical protein